MESLTFLSKNKISRLPETPGVYAFKNKKALLYIGKAQNIKKRVKNHFSQPAYRDNLFINQVSKVGFIKTESEIEALILEANLIKKFQPKFNVMWRDDKNYFYVGITKEKFPRVFITHQPKNFKSEILNLKSFYVGPFVDGKALKKTLVVLRKIFPYYTTKKHPTKQCLWCHLEMCPGPAPNIKKYKKNIRNLIAVLQGKKKSVLKNLKKEMKISSKLQNFEKAGEIRDQIRALEKVISHTKIFSLAETPYSIPKLWHRYGVWKKIERDFKKVLKTDRKISRIEGYDISNIQGKEATGSMVVAINGKMEKSQYRKFKIKIPDKPNDVAMLKEVISRRFNHPEWQYPEIMLIDGGKPQLNAALEIKNSRLKTKDIKVVALAKKHNQLFIENQKKALSLNSLPNLLKFVILQVRDEAHRFAITYHRKLRKRALLP